VALHSGDAVLVGTADAVANATVKLMASDQLHPQLRDQRRDGLYQDSLIRTREPSYATRWT
jgi:hypothetical protein